MSLFLGFFQFVASSQVATVAAGASLANSAGSVSLSVGQIDYGSFGSSIILYWGIQQVYDPFMIPIDAKLGISVWPNPVFTSLHIDIKSNDLLDITYQLYAIDGKLMYTKQSSNNNTTINMMHFAQATYLLVVRLSDKRTFKFKIIKN